MSKSKTYRGKRKYYNPCGCFHCGGHDVDSIRRIEDIELKKLTKEEIDEYKIEAYRHLNWLNEKK